MPIEFHCVHCGHKVKAPDDAAGKRGKCPTCKNSVYVPTPSEDIEPLRLAPIDETARREREREEENARQSARRIREDRTEPAPEGPKVPLPEPTGDVRLAPDMETLVTEYVLCMAESKLTEAEELAKDVRAHLAAAQEYIQRLTQDELPPTRLAHIPRGVLLKFLKQLQTG